MPVANGARHILVVDDEKDLTDSLKIGLERHGFIVDAYNDPKEALADLKPNRYDLAIFDIRMPEMNGFELYRQFKKLDAQTAVCFFTAFDVNKGEFERVFPDVNVKAFLRKPMTIPQLVTRLNSIFEEPSAETQMSSRHRGKLSPAVSEPTE